MDFAQALQWVTFLLAVILAISDIRERRSRAKNNDINSDTQMMEAIKKASLDLLKPFQEENVELRVKLNKSDSELDEQKIQTNTILSENRQITKKLNDLQTEINTLKDALKVRDSERTEWEKGITILLNQLVKAKIVPLWLPDGVTVSEIEIEPKLIISGFGQK